MKVLHLVKTAIGAKWALNQTHELVKLGLEVHVAMPTGPMVEAYRQVGVTVHPLEPSLSLGNPWLTLTRARALRAMVDALQPDLVHSHFVTSSLLMRVALVGCKLPRIFQVPGPLHLEYRLFRDLEIASASQYDHWLASCEWTRQCYLRQGIAPSRVGLAYYGVKPQEFVAPEQSDMNLKQQLGMTAEDLLIGMVAYFYAPKRYLGQRRGLKGHEDLIDALAIVRQSLPTARCVFVGGPWGNASRYFEQVQAYAQKKVGDAAIFLGTRQDVAWLYPQFDLAVHPSHSENVGGAVESLFAQVPTITSKVGGFPDLIKAGETGYLFEPKNPASLAQQILTAWREPQQRQRQVKAGLERVSKLMDVQQNAKDVLNFYYQVLANQHHAARAR